MITLDSIVELLLMADHLNLGRLKTRCLLFARQEMDELGRRDELQHLPKGLLLELMTGGVN